LLAKWGFHRAPMFQFSPRLPQPEAAPALSDNRR